MEVMGDGGILLTCNGSSILEINVPFQVGTLSWEAWIEQVQRLDDEFLGKSFLFPGGTPLDALHVVARKGSVARDGFAMQCQLRSTLEIADWDNGSVVFANRPRTVASNDGIEINVSPEFP